MACGACMTHTNPEPCCGPSRHFGNPSSGEWRPFGYDLVQIENPPWWQTALGGLIAYAGHQMKDPDVSFILIAGGLAVPGMMWLRYSSSNEG